MKARKKVVIDIDATDAETYGDQQLSIFNGFYGHTMYYELFFHDGEIILPVLRPGNAHSNWWYVAILKRIVKKIRTKYPQIEIIIRADSGFSTPWFYKYADSQENLKYTIAIASNNVLKKGLKGQRRQSDKSTCPKKKSTSTLLAHISAGQVLGKSHKTVIQKSRVLAKG